MTTTLMPDTTAGRCPAGSIAFFSSHALHRSGPNATPRQRRVYLPQHSSAPLLKEDGTPFYIAEPLLINGKRVASGR